MKSRSEAKSVPTLLVAPITSDPPTGPSIDRSHGYYANGAYTAAPDAPTRHELTAAQDDDDDVDPQGVYYACLLQRFADLSTSLKDPPDASYTSASISNNAQDLNAGFSSRWRSALNTQPSMVLIGLLSQEAVLQGLRMLDTRLTIQKLMRTESMSLWIWGLLGRCRDAGQMDSEGIGTLRDLGKKAIWLLRGIQAGSRGLSNGHEERDEDYSEQEEAYEVEGNSEEFEMSQTLDDSEPSTALGRSDPTATVADSSFLRPPPTVSSTHVLDDAKAHMLASLPPDTDSPSAEPEDTRPHDESSTLPSITKPESTSGDNIKQEEDSSLSNIHMALDMIITIVGECYGQRDLLDGRLVWGELDEDKA